MRLTLSTWWRCYRNPTLSAGCGRQTLTPPSAAAIGRGGNVRRGGQRQPPAASLPPPGSIRWAGRVPARRATRPRRRRRAGSRRRPAAGASASRSAATRCCCLQRQADVFPRGAEPPRIDGDAGQPAGRAAAGMLGHEADAGQVAQGLAVELEVRPPPLDAVVQHAQLPPAHRRQQVAHAVVVADLRVLVVRGRVAGLRGQEAGPFGQAPCCRRPACRRRWW